jgi:hypothetical protein
MSEELNKELASLASKLGTSVEHLWGVMVKQAYIDGISSLVTTLVCLLLGVAVVHGFFYVRRNFKSTPHHERTHPFDFLMDPLGFVVIGVILLAIFAVASDNFYWVISDFWNPEFYAMRHLPFSK